MSFKFIRHRKDSNHSPIVEAIEKAGYIVDDDTRVDLQVRHPGWLPNIWVKLECKVKNRKDGFKPRKDQKDQTDYCEAHGIPFTSSPEDALEYLDRRGARLWG